MAFIVEDGSGVAGANSYVLTSFIDAYLADRNRSEENGWVDLDLTVKQAYAIEATDYVENRWRDCFMGRKQFTSLKHAKGVLTLTANPSDAETVTIGTTVYTFNTALGGAFSVLIGANASESLDNLVKAIVMSPGDEGLLYGSGTTIHPTVNAYAFFEDTIIIQALVEGTPGNLIATTTTLVNGTFSSTTLIGGSDVGRPQPLSFPRVNLRDRDGQLVVGIPELLKNAIAEYAVRLPLGSLQPDPDLVSGNQIIEKEEVIGPIKERTKWREGGAVNSYRPIPAGDRLVRTFIQTSGTVCRA